MKRPEELARGGFPIINAITNVLETLNEKKTHISDVVVLLQQHH